GVSQHLHYFGELEEPGQAHDLHRYALVGQGLLERNEQPAGPAQHGELRPRGLRPRVVLLADVTSDPLRLRPLVGEPPELDIALAAPGPGRQLLLRVRPLLDGDLLDDPIGRGEDARPRSEVRIERELRGRGPVAMPGL